MPAIVAESAIPLVFAAPGPMAGPSPTSAFVMQLQAQDRWCWAATAVSVTLFYVPASSMTQCRMANDLFGRQTCCGSGGPTDACNKKGDLEAALAHTGVLDHPPDPGPVIMSVIRNEIDHGRVLCWRFAWAFGPGAHFGVIADYAEGDVPQVHLFDPWLGATWARLDDFSHGVYIDHDHQTRSGEWTDTYFTRTP